MALDNWPSSAAFHFGWDDWLRRGTGIHLVISSESPSREPVRWYMLSIDHRGSPALRLQRFPRCLILSRSHFRFSWLNTFDAVTNKVLHHLIIVVVVENYFGHSARAFLHILPRVEYCCLPDCTLSIGSNLIVSAWNEYKSGVHSEIVFCSRECSRLFAFNCRVDLLHD